MDIAKIKKAIFEADLELEATGFASFHPIRVQLREALQEVSKAEKEEKNA